jgi:hypothetical protein
MVIVLLFGFLAGTVLSGVDNGYQENEPLVLYDDNLGFWGWGGVGTGSISVLVSASTSTVQNGTSSLQKPSYFTKLGLIECKFKQEHYPLYT